MSSYYSSKKDPIHYYFKEKYEIVTASKETLNILKSHSVESIENSPIPIENRTTVFKKLIKGFEEIPEESFEDFNQTFNKNRYSFSKKKKARHEKLKILQEIQKKKKDEVLDMSKEMTNFLENSRKNDLVIAEDLKKQFENIVQKYKQKKQLNNSHNQENSSFRFNQTEPSEISIL